MCEKYKIKVKTEQITILEIKVPATKYFKIILVKIKLPINYYNMKTSWKLFRNHFLRKNMSAHFANN